MARHPLTVFLLGKGKNSYFSAGAHTSPAVTARSHSPSTLQSHRSRVKRKRVVQNFTVSFEAFPCNGLQQRRSVTGETNSRKKNGKQRILGRPKNRAKSPTTLPRTRKHLPINLSL
ncbi:hypothetical protein L2E82_44886 [Cichorium intybus]|uniref:Uncharacterized protein n=1 Tax=Cichorium intybus TaxID=13427 RepID=A0ACB8ZRC8_CICIN|nr:hypothetical protein L2E82_44886 [Cichorium intybus]